MPRPTREEERLTEDDIVRRNLGPRGVPGAQDTAKMTPQQEKNMPKTGEFDGHTRLIAQSSMWSPRTNPLPRLSRAADHPPTFQYP